MHAEFLWEKRSRRGLGPPTYTTDLNSSAQPTDALNYGMTNSSQRAELINILGRVSISIIIVVSYNTDFAVSIFITHILLYS